MMKIIYFAGLGLSLLLGGSVFAGTDYWIGSWNERAIVKVLDRWDSGSDREATVLFDSIRLAPYGSGSYEIKSFSSGDSRFNATCGLNFQTIETSCILDLRAGDWISIDKKTGRVAFEVTGEDAKSWYELFKPEKGEVFEFRTADGRLSLKVEPDHTRFEFKDSP